jgi:predicted peroxiredoxin
MRSMAWFYMDMRDERMSEDRRPRVDKRGYADVVKNALQEGILGIRGGLEIFLDEAGVERGKATAGRLVEGARTLGSGAFAVRRLLVAGFVAAARRVRRARAGVRA